jgi:endonuclease/exonuclease/phosphatase family metal-dependent hydrolase
VKVLTWNLYIGADLSRAVEAETPDALLAANAEIFRVLHQTSFPERARSIAARIVEADVVVVALQEAAAWFTGPLGAPSPASKVEYDFVGILDEELARQGAGYDAVVVQGNSDSEAAAGPPYSSDIRLLDRDALLVRSDLVGDVSSTEAAHFDRQLTIPTGTGRMVEALRGWMSVDLIVEGRPIRFVNTHLEAFDPQVRLAQAEELVSPTGPIGPPDSGAADVVLLGDLNSGPELPVLDDRLAFFALMGAGLTDTWAVLHPGDPGYTAGFNELLDDPSPTVLEHRVDHVMTRGGVAAVSSEIVGTAPRDRTTSGMWPSDHAGLVASLET